MKFQKTKFIALLTGVMCASAVNAAIITDVSNIDGGTVSAIDRAGDADNFDANSPATNSTALATVNSNVDYVISNWGSGWTDGSNTLQDVFGTLDITITESNLTGSNQWDPATTTTPNRALSGDSYLAANFQNGSTFTISFSEAVDTVGFGLLNFGTAWTDDTGEGIFANFFTGENGTGTNISSQSWSNGGADAEGSSPNHGQSDAYFGLSGGTSFQSVVVNVVTDASGGVGFDDLGLGVIPEPSTFVLFGLAGLAAVIGLRRRR